MKELDWQPTIKLREGLIKTIDYFDDLRRSGTGQHGVGASRGV